MKHKWSIVAEEFFQFSLITYLILLLAETIKEGFVSYFFDLNILLGVVIVSGILMILTNDYRIPQKETKKSTARNWEFFFILSVAGGLLVYYKTEELGGISLVLTVLSGVTIFLLSYLIMTDEE